MQRNGQARNRPSINSGHQPTFNKHNMTASDSKLVHTRNVKALGTYMNFLNVFFSFGASAMLCVLLGRKRNNAAMT
jgi:hypothetical protein